MRNERYEVDISQTLMTFDFTSEGPKGFIKKRVQYQITKEENLYNLAFGDLNLETDEIDDKAISDNKDSRKVLSTVGATIFRVHGGIS